MAELNTFKPPVARQSLGGFFVPLLLVVLVDVTQQGHQEGCERYHQ